MEHIYEDIFKELLTHQTELGEYVDSLYNSDDYSDIDLNHIFGKLKRDGLITCIFADNRAWVHSITYAGKHYFDERTRSMSTVQIKKKPRIFISHSSNDKEYVKKIVELLSTIGLNQTDIFCSSLPGYDIGMDQDIFECLRDQFEKYSLHVFIIHSENYYNSHVSLNEMGAAWVLRNKCTSILLPGFEFGEMRGVVGSRTVSLKLDKDVMEVRSKLNQICDELVDEFDLLKPNSIIWEEHRDRFINEISSIKNPKSEAFDHNTMKNSEDGKLFFDKQRREDVVITYLTEHPYASTREIASVLGVANPTAIRLLDSMIRDGFIETTGENRSRTYILKR